MTRDDATLLALTVWYVWLLARVALYYYHIDALRAEVAQRDRDREAAQHRAQWYEVARHLAACRDHFRALRLTAPSGPLPPTPPPAPPWTTAPRSGTAS